MQPYFFGKKTPVEFFAPYFLYEKIKNVAV